MTRPLLLLLAVALAWMPVRLAAAQDPPPQFRTGVTVTRLDVTVLDRQTRKPVTGLMPDDFVVKVDGTIQPIVSLAEIAVPGAGTVTAPAFVEAAEEVTRNELESPRAFVLVMNDARGGIDPFYRKNGKDIAHRFIDLLGPEDLAAVIFVQRNQHAQDLTRDRTLLRRAIDRFDPSHAEALCPLHVVLRTQQFLRSMTAYRPAVVFVSATPPRRYIECERRPPWDLLDIEHAARFADVPVYTFSAQGLHAATGNELAQAGKQAAQGRSAFATIDANADALRTVAGVTGGTATINTNTPAEFVPAVFEELGTYYALAFEQTYPADGGYRRIQVQVTRPDAMVVSSRTVIAAAKPPPEAGAAARGAALRSGLMDALESPVAIGAIPLRLSALPLAVGGAREQAVALTLVLPPVDDAERFHVQLFAHDGEGVRRFAEQTHTIDIARGTDGEPTEVALRLNLRPGRYNIRLAAERASDDTAGSVHATVVVPDFAREALSLSGVAIGRGDGRRIVGRGELGDLLPFAPTAVRTFDRTDRVGALLRVHQPARRVQTVTLDTEILDPTGIAVVTHTRTIEPDAFDEGTAEHRYELPLATLEPGDYLLRFTAIAGAARAQRDVRFSVR
jgi:VWFA-related protein